MYKYLNTFVLLYCVQYFIYGNQAQTNIPGARHVFRQYTCIAIDELELADCRLNFFMTSDDEPSTITQSGCFIEKDLATQQLRHFCPLQCQNALAAYIWGRRPTLSPPLQDPCISNQTYNVAKRRSDWFLWRSNECLTTESQFDIGCVYSPIPNNEVLNEAKNTDGSDWQTKNIETAQNEEKKERLLKSIEISRDFLIAQNAMRPKSKSLETHLKAEESLSVEPGSGEEVEVGNTDFSSSTVAGSGEEPLEEK